MPFGERVRELARGVQGMAQSGKGVDKIREAGQKLGLEGRAKSELREAGRSPAAALGGLKKMVGAHEPGGATLKQKGVGQLKRRTPRIMGSTRFEALRKKVQSQ